MSFDKSPRIHSFDSLDEKVVRLCIEYLESIPLRGVFLPEVDRARIHALTRKATVTDEEIRQIRLDIESDWADGATMIDIEGDDAIRKLAGKGPRRNWEDAMKDLRDRYEERGQFAPSVDSMPTDVNIPDPKQR